MQEISSVFGYVQAALIKARRLVRSNVITASHFSTTLTSHFLEGDENKGTLRSEFVEKCQARLTCGLRSRLAIIGEPVFKP
jgi:hypothetical protein